MTTATHPLPTLENLPEELTAYGVRRWIIWRNENGSKIPYQPREPQRRASSTTPEHWTLFTSALIAAQRSNSGVGFVFAEGDGYVGVDLDDCLNERGELTAWAAEILRLAGETYSEVSPSGRGIKIWLRGSLPGNKGVRHTLPGGGDVEAYSTGRYFTVTGQRWNNAPLVIGDGAQAIDYILALARTAKAYTNGHTNGHTNGVRFPAVAPASDGNAAGIMLSLIEQVRNAPEGNRNNTLNKAGYTLGGLLASGAIGVNERNAYTSLLFNAAREAGLPDVEAQTTLEHSIIRGAETPFAPDDGDEYMRAIRTLKLNLRYNLVRQIVEVDGEPLTDAKAAEIRTKLRNMRLRNGQAIEDAILVLANRNAYHPVQDYLNALQWDGIDYVSQVAQCITTDDPPVIYANGETKPLIEVYLRKWLIGAVRRAFTGKQNPVLVLSGGQGIGKSHFARWLGSGLPGYYAEAHLDPHDKDCIARMARVWIWEIAELDATTRRSDVAALKAALTRESITVRLPYGRREQTYPALAAFVATINDTGGFLTDESGSRRFMCLNVVKIDWRYADIPVERLWAQAIALWKAGESADLTPEERVHQESVNLTHTTETPLLTWIRDAVVVTGDLSDYVTLAQICDNLYGKIGSFNPSTRNEIARCLRMLGATPMRNRAERRYCGVKLKEDYSFSSQSKTPAPAPVKATEERKAEAASAIRRLNEEFAALRDTGWKFRRCTAEGVIDPAGDCVRVEAPSGKCVTVRNGDLLAGGRDAVERLQRASVLFVA